MISAIHFLAGAAVATQVPEILPASMAAIVLHFAADAIPHVDYIGKPEDSPVNRWITIADAVFGLAIFWLVVPAEFRIYGFIVGLIGVLPDLMSGPLYLWPKLRQIGWWAKFHHWHTYTLQHSWGKINLWLGILPQLIVLGWIVWYFLGLN